ncbi:MAG: TonB-dependent receptor [Vicinamibacterales bacterium]
MERTALHRDDDRGAQLHDRRDAARHEPDGAPAGDHAGDLLTQHRATSTWQFIESASGTAHGWGGMHLYKAGVDVLNSRYSSRSTSRPVLIRRSDGTLARRLDFSPAQTSQQMSSTDLAIYAQDRVQPGDRWYAEFGARLDRDGARGTNPTPRVGVAFLLNKDGSSVLRSGYGPSSNGRRRSPACSISTKWRPTRASPRTASRQSARRRSCATSPAPTSGRRAASRGSRSRSQVQRAMGIAPCR